MRNGRGYRDGIAYAKGVPRAYQPRKGGPPLLFATDMRTTILVHLALAHSPVRTAWLWKHIGKSAKTCLYPLVQRGLVAKWSLGSKVFVALDPCHPAAAELRDMLVAIGHHYQFKPIPIDVDAREGGDAPVRPSRRRDIRYTFGDRQRTMPLLLVHILGETMAADIERIVRPRLDKGTARHILEMYRAFGLLQSRYFVWHKKRAIMFSFNNDHPLVPYVRAVLGALDRAMPQWRIVAERQKTQPVLNRRQTSYSGRRKPNRWKW